VQQPLEVAQDVRRAVGREQHAVDEVRPREVEVLGRDGLAVVGQQVLGVVAEQFLQARGGQSCGRHGPIPSFACTSERAA
jgi:hypothetical protein